MKKRKLALILISSSVLSFCFGQVKISSKFKKIDTPKEFSEKWLFLNASNLEYKVKNKDGKLIVNIDNVYKDFELRLNDGRLIGTNYSDDTGYLYFQPIDTLQKKICIKKGNVEFVFKLNDQLYFIESVATGYERKGYIYKLDKLANSFSYSKVLEIDDTPLAFLLDKNILYVATNGNFILIRNFEQEIIFKDAFWRGLYPNSIAYFNDKNVYLGLRGGIVKLNLVSKSIEYYESVDNYN